MLKLKIRGRRHYILHEYNNTKAVVSTSSGKIRPAFCTFQDLKEPLAVCQRYYKKFPVCPALS